MSTTLGRRLGRLESLVQEEQKRRLIVAVKGLVGSMSPEHRRIMHGWMVEHQRSKKRCALAHPVGWFCLHCIEQDEPPALVRAAWVLIFQHVEDETPVALPPSVAETYVEHPDAVPGWPCSGCGYPLPAQRGYLAYAGACPVCGLDNHPNEEDEP